jgi:hypothetical protein
VPDIGKSGFYSGGSGHGLRRLIGGLSKWDTEMLRPDWAVAENLPPAVFESWSSWYDARKPLIDQFRHVVCTTRRPAIEPGSVAGVA